MEARVGIVVPAFNASRFLAATLDSVLSQSETDWRCIIIDDGSTDDTAHIAQRYADRDARFSLIRQANAGVSRARTAGLDALNGNWEHLIFLDADDIWEPDTLRTLLATLNANPNAPAVHAIARFIDDAGQPLSSEQLDTRLKRLDFRDGVIVDVTNDQPTSTTMLATWPCVLTPGIVLIRKSAWDRSGGWDPSLSIGEDWELWYRLSLQAPLAFIALPLIRFRVYATSSSNNWRRPFRLAQARAKVFAAGTNEQQRTAKRAFRAMSRRLGWARLREGLMALGKFKVSEAAKRMVGGTINLGMSLRP